jgi:hypothetical protein
VFVNESLLALLHTAREKMSRLMKTRLKEGEESISNCTKRPDFKLEPRKIVTSKSGCKGVSESIGDRRRISDTQLSAMRLGFATSLTSLRMLPSRQPVVRAPAEHWYHTRVRAACGVRHYVNLTNGLEGLDALSQLVPPEELRFTRLQSSHCEAGAYDKILGELDHDLLWSLASGHTCVPE